MKTKIQESNELIDRLSAEKGIDETILNDFWEQAKNDQILFAKTKVEKDQSNRNFWVGVKERFMKKVDDLDITEARSIMDARDRFNDASVQFLDALQNNNYIKAKEVFPDIVSAKTDLIINNFKQGYLKNLAQKSKDNS